MPVPEYTLAEVAGIFSGQKVAVATLRTEKSLQASQMETGMGGKCESPIY